MTLTSLGRTEQLTKIFAKEQALCHQVLGVDIEEALFVGSSGRL